MHALSQGPTDATQPYALQFQMLKPRQRLTQFSRS